MGNQSMPANSPTSLTPPPANPTGIPGWKPAPGTDPNLFGGAVPGFSANAPAANPAGIPGWHPAPGMGKPPSTTGKGG
jgi:hypothetical protein